MNYCNSISEKKKNVKCKYHDKGFCYNRMNCRYSHPKEICQDSDCYENNNCHKRHPKMCLFFSFYKKCKFGESCFFKHVKTNNAEENTEMKKNDISQKKPIKHLEEKNNLLEIELKDRNYQLNNLQKENKSQEDKISDLLERIDTTEKDSKSSKGVISNLREINESNAEEIRELKIKIKQSDKEIKKKDAKLEESSKENTYLNECLAVKELKIENDRKELFNLQVIINDCDEKKEFVGSINKEVHGNKKRIVQTENGQYKCVQCEFKTKSQSEMLAHMKSKHIIKGTDSTNTCEVCGWETESIFGLNMHKASEHGILPKLV